MNKMYPIALKLDNRSCLIVGAGRVAERKVAALLETGADIQLIGPEAVDEIKALAAGGKISWEKRVFGPGDTAGAFLVIAATGSAAINRMVYDDARKQGALINVVDEPALCDFFVPAVLERGHLQLAISTGGRSPALAGRIKQRLAGEFGPEYEDYLEIVGRFREEIISTVSDPEARLRAYERLFESDLLDEVRRGVKVDPEGLARRYAG
jgi:precorrin-2 dehydrogenase / sirohydrochlorin ferrochelatase